LPEAGRLAGRKLVLAVLGLASLGVRLAEAMLGVGAEALQCFAIGVSILPSW